MEGNTQHSKQRTRSPTKSDKSVTLKDFIKETRQKDAEVEEQISVLLGVVTDQQQQIEQLKREVDRLFAIAYEKINAENECESEIESLSLKC